MTEVRVKTHLIITDIHEEYTMKWHGKIKEIIPKLENGMPIFVVIGGSRRVVLNTIDMKRIETCAKKLTYPKGKGSFTTDSAQIYIVEENGNEKLMGVLIHNRIKKYAPMFDKVGYIY